MAKKSSKATTPSWRTLMRRAKSIEKNYPKSPVAAKLRADAAKLRKAKPTSPTVTAPRSEAMKKAWATRRAKAVQSVPDPGMAVGEWNVIASYDMQGEVPGHGEIIGGAEHQFAEEIAKLARKKGGKDAIQNLITNRIATARAEVQNSESDVARKRLIELRERIDEQIVCSWLAEVDALQTMSRGIPPDTVFQIGSLTVVKIVDALNRAGYTNGGRKS
jgi:hypothetical protein